MTLERLPHARHAVFTDVADRVAKIDRIVALVDEGGG
jgi:hypothetical protein